METLPFGLYEALLDEKLKSVLASRPELRSVFGKVEADEEPTRYAAFVASVVERVLRSETDSDKRLLVCNQIVEQMAGDRAGDLLQRLVSTEKSVLLEITPPHYAKSGMPRPETSLTESSLFTGSPSDPQLVHELQQEMPSADSVDVLISFIKWSGLRLLMSAFEELTQRGGRVRVITTSFMGASDAPAVEWLARLPNTSVRVSYDIGRTRLHAKAYHFHRHTGFSTAYIGSANMSHAAMTSGLEWNLKVTAQDLPHIVEKFVAEFETYWNSREFIPFDPEQPQDLREALSRGRDVSSLPAVFFDIRPHAFQERILDALEAERQVHGHWRNLVVAATGTGKTVVAAFDFNRFFEQNQRQAKLLYVAHRREILEQAIGTFRAVLRSPDFGELLVGPYEATRLDHLFCSIDMLQSRRLWEKVGREFYDFIIVDEVHHGPASSYRSVFDCFEPTLLLGLTATPERMDGQSVLADFGDRFAAEIRLPEALEEKLLCPFHYFAVADPVSLAADSFWKGGRYDVQALSNVYTGEHALAKQRLEVVLTALTRYEPDLAQVRGLGFCVNVSHAEFMASEFNKRGIKSDVLVGETDDLTRSRLLEDLRAGRLTFLFTRDVLNEGLDVPEVNTVLFLRPTESLTVFLQQLGRGLRHSPGKDCLTVLDFVGQVHRRYRIDRKFKALLPKTRFNIEREVEMNFPHLPTGCSIQLDRVARDYVLANIRENLRRLSEQVIERLQTFSEESGQELSFTNFISYHDYDPVVLLEKNSWADWRAKAQLIAASRDPDRERLKAGLMRAATVNGPRELRMLLDVASRLRRSDVEGAIEAAGSSALAIHYRLWGKPGRQLGFETLQASFQALARNPAFLSDLLEVLAWADSESRVGAFPLTLPFDCTLELHAQYGFDVIKAALGKATFESAAERGVGLLHCPNLNAYALFVTFQKTEREFSPSTMYADYPVSRELMHWESPSNIAQGMPTGQNLIHHEERGYSILIFARTAKRDNGNTVPFTFIGPAQVERFEDDRPIKMVWRLSHQMPAAMFEENRRGG